MGEVHEAEGSRRAWYARPLVFTGLNLAVLTAARLALLLIYGDEFTGLSGADLVEIFLRGARFDISIALSLGGPALVLLAAPLGWARSRRGQLVAGWWCYAAFIFTAFLAAADLVYFGYVNRHLGPELAIAQHDADQTVELVLRQYWIYLLLFVAGAYLAFRYWRHCLHGTPPVEPPRGGLARRLAATAGLIALAVVGARGGAWGDRLKIESSYDGVPANGARLVLNGPFSAINHLIRTRGMKANFAPWKEAVTTTRAQLIASDEEAPRRGFPLYREAAAPETPDTHPNVVIVMLEGWSASAVDVLRREAGLNPIGVTPRFDALCKEGVWFTRFFATGQRTRNGLASIVAGVPSLPRMPYLGEGLEHTRLSYLGQLAHEYGYATYFLQGFKGKSQRQDLIAKGAGFDTFTAAEQLLGAKGETVLDRRAPDAVLMRAASEQLARAPQPFLAFVHTAATHEPYLWDAKRHTLYEGQAKEHRYWNSVASCDAAVGEFLDRAKSDGWYDDTVFVVVSDHIQRRMEGELDPPGLFHIPCVLLGPGLTPRRDDRVASQVDLLPTIRHLAGWRTPYAAFGRSLLGELPDDYGAMCRWADLLIRVEPGGWVAHNLERRVDGGAYRDGADLDAIETRLLHVTQVATRLLLTDRMLPPREEGE